MASAPGSPRCWPAGHRRCHLSAGRAGRPGGHRPRAGRAPAAGALTLGVRPRLLLSGALTSAVPLLGICCCSWTRPIRDGPTTARWSRWWWSPLLVGGLATVLTARSVGEPLGELRRGGGAGGRRGLRRPGHRRRRGEIGLLERGVNSMAGGLASASGCGTCSAGTSGRRWRSAPSPTASRSGRGARPSAALFVDIAGSTSLVLPHRPERDGRAAQPLLRRGGRGGRGRGRAGQQVRGRRRAVRVRRARRAATTRPAPRCAPPGGSSTASREPARSTSGSASPAGRSWPGRSARRAGFEYTVIGDPVNEAARLTELAKEHPCRASRAAPTVRAAGGRNSGTGSPTARSGCAAATRSPGPGCAGPEGGVAGGADESLWAWTRTACTRTAGPTTGYRRSAGTDRGEARRRDLLDRVTDDLAAHGLVDFSLRRAARAAGTTHKVLLYHFAGADDLLTPGHPPAARPADRPASGGRGRRRRTATAAERVRAIWPVLIGEESRMPRPGHRADDVRPGPLRRARPARRRRSTCRRCCPCARRPGPSRASSRWPR